MKIDAELKYNQFGLKMENVFAYCKMSRVVDCSMLRDGVLYK